MFQTASEREANETKALGERVNQFHQKVLGRGLSYLTSLVDRLTCELDPALAEEVAASLRTLLEEDGILVPWEAPSSLLELSQAEHIAIREHLRRKERVLGRFPVAGDKLYGFLGYIVSQLFGHLEGSSLPAVEIPAAYLKRDFQTFFDCTVKGLACREMASFELFQKENSALQSTIRHDRNFAWPEDSKETDPYLLVDDYLPNSHFGSLCLQYISYNPPANSRLEHCHIVGGSGHGKSELLKSLILADVPGLLARKRSILVMDSQGDLLQSLLRLSVFHPLEGKLKDRLIIIDPHDLDRPPALNLFALKTDSSDPLTREKQVQSAVSLYEYLFGSLLGAELTQRQGTLFSYLARLMMVIPNATIHTLRDVLEDGHRFKPYMEKLAGSPREFFETRFFHPAFTPVKTQIVNRLWGILSTGTLDRMFSGAEMAIDLGKELQAGKVILVNTAKELLKDEASSFFGKFILSLLSHAIIERASIPQKDRLQTHVYIDEAQEYLDGTLAALFAQARKYKVGLTIAHQNLDQLDPSLRSVLASSTTIKFAGGVSDKDARALASDMKTSPDFLLERQKGDSYTDFALSIRNVLPRAASAIVHLGGIDELGENDDGDLELIRKRNSERYGRAFVERECRPPTISKEEFKANEASPQPASVGKPEPNTLAYEGKGSREHKYLQALVRQLAQEAGYLAELEKRVAEGYVDVLLSRDDHTIAVEIALSTDPSYEVKNLRKCLQLRPAQILVVSPKPAHLAIIRKQAEIQGFDLSSVQFISPDELPSRFPKREEPPPTDEVKRSRGYTVRVKREAGEEAEERRRRVAGVVAGTIRKEK